MHVGDIVIHIDEELDDRHILDLEKTLGEEHGIYSACVHENRRHLMLVDFDPENIRPSDIVHSVRRNGLHAEMVGF
jgi:hypothetical protein